MSTDRGGYPDFEGTRLAEILGDLSAGAAREQPWTPEEIAGFRERFAAAMANPGPLRVLPSEHWQARAEAAEAKLAAQCEYETYWRALWVIVRQLSGSVFLTSAQIEAVPLLASLGVGREPRGIRINASEEP